MSDAEGRGSVPTLTKAPASQSGPRNSAAKDPDDVPPGTQIGGHYQIERRLGGGAIGHVYEATNTWTTRRVALKLLRRDFADDPEIAQRFLIEARAATAVAHPNIVDILDMGEDAQTRQLYIVQEFLEGCDLHEHLQKKGRLSVEEAAEVLLPVMQALATAHERGVLHRDLKPENIFLLQGPEGGYFPKVIDFGLARTDATTVNRVTRIGAVMGTPFYMSPEQARGDTNTDARADVWAMGVIWYECLTGGLPFDGDNLQSVLHQIFVVDPERLERRAPQVPVAVADAIHRAITRDLAARWGSMIDFLEALDVALPPPPQQALRSSRPGRGSQAASRSIRPTPTPAGGLPRGKLVVGPPRRPGESNSPEPEINPAFEATLHATPSPVIR